MYWPVPHSAYGITVDSSGYVWTCNDYVARFDPMSETPSSIKSTRTAYGLAALALVGLAGVQRWYLGKRVSAVVWLLTLGLLGLGQLYDLVTMPSQVRDANLRIGLGKVVGRSRAVAAAGKF